jgi:hypothetical protein
MDAKTANHNLRYTYDYINKLKKALESKDLDEATRKMLQLNLDKLLTATSALTAPLAEVEKAMLSPLGRILSR